MTSMTHYEASMGEYSLAQMLGQSDIKNSDIPSDA